MYNNTGLNKAILVGHITREPRLHTVQQSKQQLCFTISTREIIGSKTEKEHIEFHHIKVDANNTCLANLELKKGQLVYVQGKVQTHSFTDEQQVRRYKTEIMALNVTLFEPVLVAS